MTDTLTIGHENEVSRATQNNLPKLIPSETKVDALYGVLKELHSMLSHGESMKINLGGMLKKRQVPDWISRFIFDSGLIKKLGNHGPTVRYKWADIFVDPTRENASEIYVAMLEAMREKNYKNRLNKKLKVKKEKTAPEKPNTANASKVDKSDFAVEKSARVLELIKIIHEILKGSKTPITATNLRLREHAIKCKVGHATLASLIPAGVLKRSGTHASNFAYKWIAGAPTKKLVEKILTQEKDFHINKNSKRTDYPVANREEKIKKVAVAAPATDDKKELWKLVAKKAIDLDDPASALAALNKL
jgi:hypothetical protein